MHPPVRLAAIDLDGTLLPSSGTRVSLRNVLALKAAQKAGMIIAIATGRRAAFTIPLLDGLDLRADTPLITSNGAVTRALGGQLDGNLRGALPGNVIDRCQMPARVARGVCTLLRPFGCVVFTFDRAGRGELVLEDFEQAHRRIALWVDANRSSIEVVKPLEDALPDNDNAGDDPIQGMAAGTVEQMRAAEKALKASPWAAMCEAVRTEYPARDLSILDLLPLGVTKGRALERLAARLGVSRPETMAIGDNWNDQGMFEWAGQALVMANAPPDLRALAKVRGWKQAPSNDQDGVACVLEAALKKLSAASLATAARE
jgi:hydroxymethylpyrimidine pyrophosphatase-like HAD family hydrolase